MEERKTSRKKFWYNDNTVGYIFSLPFIIGFLAFTLIPIAVSMYYSVTDYKLGQTPAFIGIKNYLELLKDERFINSVKVTLIYVVTSVPTKLIFALFVAYLLTQGRRGVTFYRSLYYVPSLIGGSIAVALVWKTIFSRKGLANTILASLGLQKLSWLGDPKLSMGILVLMSAWQFGSSMVLFLSALKQVPQSLYEAARIDGASKPRMFFKITLPMITSIAFFNIIMQLITALQNFTSAFVVTNGGPNKATYVLGMKLYTDAFKYFKMGYACATSWILFMVILVMTIILFVTSKKWVYYDN